MQAIKYSYGPQIIFFAAIDAKYAPEQPVATVEASPESTPIPSREGARPEAPKLTDPQVQALRKARDLLKYGSELRELFFHPRTVEAFIRDGAMERAGGYDGLRLTDKGLALAGMKPR